jgi:hypothetical protein
LFFTVRVADAIIVRRWKESNKILKYSYLDIIKKAAVGIMISKCGY